MIFLGPLKQRISWLAEEILDFQEDLSTMDSVKYPTICYHIQQLKDLQNLNIIDVSCIPFHLP
jgi:hypothetical protein